MTAGALPTIWITGCAGFLGNRLTAKFAAQGHAVVGLSRRKCVAAGRSFAIDLAAREAPARIQDLIAELGRPDVVVHAASQQPGGATLTDFIRSNVQSTANLLAAFQRNPPGQIIYTSTQSVYVAPASLPVKETAPAPGTLPYSATKRWAEQLLQLFREHCRITILRLPSLFGKGQADSFVEGLARSALRGQPLELFAQGTLIRDALHVNDVVTAIQSCFTRSPDEPFCLMNLGCGRPITTDEYARALVAALDSGSRIVPVDRPASQPDLYADINLARRRIGFEPTSLEQAMEIYAKELRT